MNAPDFEIVDDRPPHLIRGRRGGGQDGDLMAVRMEPCRQIARGNFGSTLNKGRKEG